MAATLPTKGRSVQVKRGASPATLVAGVRTKSITINGAPIDITNDDDTGIRKLLDEPGQLEVSISVSGILKNEVLLTESLQTSDRVQPTEFLWPGAVSAGSLSGDFFLASMGITGEYQGAVTFEAAFESAGAVTLVAAV